MQGASRCPTDGLFPEHRPATAVPKRQAGIRKGGSPVRTHVAAAILAAIAVFSVAVFGQENNPLTAVDVKSAKPKPAPRTADGHPDLSGYWKGTRDTVPVGNMAKDLPGLKLPLTPAGEAALQHNLTATIDPESLCIIGGIPPHKASGLPVEGPQGARKNALLYWHSYHPLNPLHPQR